MFKKSPLKASNLVKRKRRIFIAKIVLAVLVFGFSIYSVSWLFHLERFILADIVIQGNSAIDSERLESIIRSNIAGSYYFIFPKSNKFLYPKRKIINDVMAAEKRVENAKVSSSGTTLTLAVTERKPSYVWCAGSPASRGEKDCYLIDAFGYIFASAPVFSGNAFFAFYGGAATSTPVGSHFLDPDRFKKLVGLVESLDALGLRSAALLSRTDGARELYLEKGGKILFKDAADFNELLSSISTVYKTTNILSGKGAPLEYADFRYGNKIYYKFAGDNGGQLPR